MASMKRKNTKEAARSKSRPLRGCGSALFWLPLLVAAILLLMPYNPEAGWKETTFTFSSCHFYKSHRRRSFGDIQLVIFSTDGQRFDTTREEIGYLLVPGREYHAVYEEGRFTNSLRGLVDDAGHVFIDVEKTISSSKADRTMFIFVFSLPFPLLGLVFGLIDTHAHKEMQKKPANTPPQNAQQKYTL